MTDANTVLSPAPWPATALAKWPLWLPAVIAALYPFLLDGFHLLITGDGSVIPAAALLLLAFAVPALGLYIACRDTGLGGALQIRTRRIALLIVAAPTLYCFVGVNLYMLGSPVPDSWFWTPAWLLLALFAVLKPADTEAPIVVRQSSAGLRVAHGISGAVVALFIAFHLFNHLFGLFGPEAHAEMMDMGRTVYRSPLVEPLLVAALLFQVFSGLRLAWEWTSTASDFHRIFQIASGVFLSIFILGHLNAVFIFARTWAGIETDWAFATGAPTGLMLDPWSIRLVPHYALGVFFILAHLASGLRVVLLAHGTARRTADQLWFFGAGIAALVSLAIMLGMTGVRLG
ncbi:MAG: hypothetical protein ACN6O6_20235 [Pseudomonas sp.]|uniref:hypothetical protein n=1 Tax=Pseudomonas sp. TaxID=306 RepID=UPI003D12C5F8